MSTFHAGGKLMICNISYIKHLLGTTFMNSSAYRSALYSKVVQRIRSSCARRYKCLRPENADERVGKAVLGMNGDVAGKWGCYNL
jgi:hypothetical protein